MATVTFGQVWLNAANDPTDCMGFEVNQMSRAAALNVSSAPYGVAGTPRMRSTSGRQRTAPLTFGFVTDDQAAWLERHQGTLVCFRSPRGDKWFGYYPECPVEPRQLPNSNSVTITVTEVGYSEAVGA